MKTITKLLLTAAFLITGIGGANAGNLNWSPSATWADYAKATWDGTTNTFAWDGTFWVRAIKTGFSGDLSSYATLHATVSNITGGADHLYLKVNSNGGTEQTINLYPGENNISLATYFEKIDATNVSTFELWGPETDVNSCSAIVTDVYLYNDRANVTLVSTGFDDKNIGSCTWDSGDNIYSWQATSNNTIRMLSFPAGVLSKFSKIHIKWSGLTEGASIRVLIPHPEGGNYQYISSDANGDIYLDLINDFNHPWGWGKPTAEILSKVTQIRIGGNSAPSSEELEADASASHSMTINPADIYLEADWEVMTIADATDWTVFSNLVASGVSPLDAKLIANVDAGSTMVGAEGGKEYSGTFDGAGHTLTFNYDGSSDKVAPFKAVNGATIKDLITTGSIKSSNNLLAGIIGQNKGATSLTRCASHMSVTTTVNTNGRIGGLVARNAENGSSLTFTNCMYDGAISSLTNQAAGFVGWSPNPTTISNCLVASSNIAGGESNFTPNSITIPDGKYAYYLTKFGGSNQGTQLNKQLLTSGQAAWELNQGIGDGAWFFGQGNLNTSMVDACPALTTDNAKKVVRTQAPYTSTKLYVNPGGAIPNAVRLKALGWYIGDTESDVLTSIPADFEGGDDAIKRTKNYFKLKVGSAGATTLMVPFTTTSLPENVKAYNLTFDETEVTATKVDVITANMPVLINAPAGEYLFSADATGMNDIVLETGDNAWIVYGASTYINGALTGVYNEAGSSSASDPFSYVPANAYVLQNGEEGLGFYKVAAANTIKITSFRAYLTAQSNASRISIVYEDELAGIEGIAEQRTENVSVYDLQGRRVAQPTKGLYIVGGKKVIK